MTHYHPLEESTLAEVTSAIFTKNAHSKLAKSVMEFVVEQAHQANGVSVDVIGLKTFVEFLINKKGYN